MYCTHGSLYRAVLSDYGILTYLLMYVFYFYLLDDLLHASSSLSVEYLPRYLRARPYHDYICTVL